MVSVQAVQVETSARTYGKPKITDVQSIYIGIKKIEVRGSFIYILRKLGRAKRNGKRIHFAEIPL